jgi:hypothetical protein
MRDYHARLMEYPMRLIHAAPVALAASLLFAAPAMADNLNVEARAGAAWGGGGSMHATLGAAVGYDVDIAKLGAGVFGGVEESVDKAASGGSDARWGTSARIGAKISGLGSLYGVAGYHYGHGANATSLGAGYMKALGPVYGKLEYRHYFNQGGLPASNGAVVAVGFRF